MLNLMKLEMRKYRFRGNIIGGFIAIVIITAFMILMSIDSADQAVGNYEEAFKVADILASVTFTIFGAVLLSKLIIDEFKSKSITVLFMYPIQRRKLLVAKLAIVVLFTFAFGVMTRVLTVSGFYLFNHFAQFIPNDLSQISWMEQSIKILINSVMTSFIALIPLFFGMRKHSTVTTIVSAIFIGALLNSNAGSDFTLSSIVFVPLLLAALGIAIAYLSIRNIDDKDIV
ncbi:ABC transporter permease [Cohnella sp.]|uniref:ABC transporter permease n=1 Tax=Cohnella sp. TaxID=1883426 RepID=UPI003704439B